MANDISIKIAEDQVLPGLDPVVLLGPNGAGKTRHAVTMASWNSASMIAALRNIALPPDVVMRSENQAREQLTSHLNRRQSKPWELSSEINELFSKLMAEDSAAAIRFRDAYSTDEAAKPERTKLMQLQTVWTRLFPGRHIDFTGYRPKVRLDYSTASGEYSAQQMSDGERVALYLAGRVLDSDQNIVIVDEPEVHFHSRLASRFWNEMETLRADCRFVYITHDLPFALSRQQATFVVVMPSKVPQVVSLESGLPKEVAESLLAAATFSIHANRIIFCEGVEGSSIDQALYSAWFQSQETAVIPVETGEKVTRCTTAFGQSTLVSGVEAIGIVDRDYWPDKYLDSLPTGVTALPVHEVENLLCLERVFLSVAEHLGQSTSDAASRYEDFLLQAKEKFTGSLLTKQISERFRRRCEHEYHRALNTLSVSDDLTTTKKNHVAALDPTSWGSSPEGIFGEEEQRLSAALSGNSNDFNKYFPGKVFAKQAARTLGLDLERYVGLVCAALSAGADEPLYALGEGLEKALAEYLPKRDSGSTV